MRARATVTSKGQVTIPLEIRRRLGLEKGDSVDFIVEDGVTIIRPATASNNPFAAYAGVLGAFEGVDEVNSWLRDLRDEY